MSGLVKPDGTLDYRIVILSRRRVRAVQRTLALIPEATVTVDERERDDYAGVVPAERLVPHPPLPHLAAIRNWILDHFPEHGIVMCDDDLQWVRCLVGRKARKIEDPGSVRRIIENGLVAAHDLGLHACCWTRQAKPLMFEAYEPIGLIGPMSCLWGLLGRTFRLDGDLSARHDLDLTLQLLLRDRVVYTERRFYFYFGLIWKGKGGLQGLRTAERQGAETKVLQQRWGQYLQVSRKTKAGSSAAGIRVQRRSPLASTR